MNFAHVDGDFVFAFMSIGKNGSIYTGASTSGNPPVYSTDGTYTITNPSYLTPETKKWLIDVVNASKDKTLLLFMHFPLINRRCVDTDTEVQISYYNWATGEIATKTVSASAIATPYAGLFDLGKDAQTSKGTLHRYGFYYHKGE